MRTPFLNEEILGQRAGAPGWHEPEFEQVLAEPAKSTPPAIAATYHFEVVDAQGQPLAGAPWVLFQRAEIFRGTLDAQGSSGALPSGLQRRFDRSQPFRLHVPGHVCCIVSGAVLVADDAAVEYGGAFVDWKLAEHADPAQRAAFWAEYKALLQRPDKPGVFNFLQHDHVMRRPVRWAPGAAPAVFQARPLAIRLGPILRRTDHQQALVWLELQTPGLVRVIFGAATQQKRRPAVKEIPATTQTRHATSVRVGGRHFALVALDGLLPDTTYQYRVELGPLPATGPLPAAEADFTDEVFPRKLPAAVQAAQGKVIGNAAFDGAPWLFLRTLPQTSERLRFVHGSCRKWPGADNGDGRDPGPDLLDAFQAQWLPQQDWAQWPHFFVHTGDQIYAGDIGAKFGQAIVGQRCAAVRPGPHQVAGGGEIAFGAWAGRFARRFAAQEPPERKDLDELKALRPRVSDRSGHDLDAVIARAEKARRQEAAFAKMAPPNGAMRNRWRVLNRLLWEVPVLPADIPRVDLKRGLVARQDYRVEGPPKRSFQVDYPSAGEVGVHAADFAEYAALYEQAWSTTGTRRALAHVPSYMIFDDHEVTDDWNASDKWLALVHTAQDPLRCWPATMTDALCAYWLYQGWGNLSPQQAAADPRVQILERCRRSGRDALPELRQLVHSRAVLPSAKGADRSRLLAWNFNVPAAGWPFLVVDLRTDRDVFGSGGMSKGRMAWIEKELLATRSPAAVLVLPVPYLMPAPLNWIFRHPRIAATLDGATSLEAFRRGSDLEHPADNAVWEQVKGLLKKLQARGGALKTLVLVSGDIHLSCNLDGQLPQAQGAPRLLQLVSSGLRQSVNDSKKNLIATAYRGWGNVLSDSQGVDTHRGVVITVGGLQGPGKDLRNFVFTPSFAAVEITDQPANAAAPHLGRMPLVAQTHWTLEGKNKLVPYTFRHRTLPSGSALMTLHDPGIRHPARPSPYPVGTGGIGVVKEIEGEAVEEMVERVNEEPGDEAFELQHLADDEAFDDEGEVIELTEVADGERPDEEALDDEPEALVEGPDELTP